jgi:biopolymer transport protein ExbB
MSRMQQAKKMAAVIMLSVVAGWAVTAAAAPAAGAPAASQVQRVSLQQIWQEGGICMYPLAFMSFLALALVIYYFVVLRREQVVPAALRKDVLAKVGQGLLADARTACSYKPCAFSEIAVLALDQAETSGRVDPAQLKDVLEGEGNRQSATLQGQLQYLLDVAVIAPMIGLLGTVLGMYTAFGAVSEDLTKSNPQVLAYGVKEAIVTTVVGLMIGIPAMMFYAYFRGRASRLVSELELAASQLMAAILKKRA